MKEANHCLPARIPIAVSKPKPVQKKGETRLVDFASILGLHPVFDDVSGWESVVAYPTSRRRIFVASNCRGVDKGGEDTSLEEKELFLGTGSGSRFR